jgi:hypothetical protein
MAKRMSEILQTPENEWLTFPGGELEGQRPGRLCPTCQEASRRPDPGVTADGVRRPLCFQCYRLELDRERALENAGQLDTASDARFQEALPFEPVNQTRLSVLKAERTAARAISRSGIGRFADRRRQAQIAARHALQAIAVGLRRQQAFRVVAEPGFASVHPSELQLPASWLPFVVSQ